MKATRKSLIPKAKNKEKSTPDATIYKTKDGLRVCIVKPKEYPIDPRDPTWLQEIKSKPLETLTVAEVSNGKRWYGYKQEDLTPE